MGKEAWDPNEGSISSTSVASLAYSAKALSTSTIWASFSSYARKSHNEWMLTQIARFSTIVPEVFKPDTLALGKLGAKDEPAGKVRIFAMVDP